MNKKEEKQLIICFKYIMDAKILFKKFYEECLALKKDEYYNVDNFLKKINYSHSSFYRDFSSKREFLYRSFYYILNQTIFYGSLCSVLKDYVNRVNLIKNFLINVANNNNLNKILLISYLDISNDLFKNKCKKVDSYFLSGGLTFVTRQYILGNVSNDELKIHVDKLIEYIDNAITTTKIK